MNQLSIAEALDALGSAYRGDWSDFDGRSLRNQLNDLSAALRSGEPFDAACWIVSHGICPEIHQWAEHCEAKEALPEDHPARARGLTHYYGHCKHMAQVLQEERA